jgi:hypothetical protein
MAMAGVRLAQGEAMESGPQKTNLQEADRRTDKERKEKT